MKHVAPLLILFVLVGCGRTAKQDAAEFDALLMTGRIDRIEFLNDETEKTNVFLGERAAAVVQWLNATNRVVRPTSAWKKNYASGQVFFYRGTNYLKGLHYVPEYDALAFGYYYFGPKGTNELRRFFE